VTLPVERVAEEVGGEMHLMIRFVSKEATSWAPENHVVAWEQFSLPSAVRAREEKKVSDVSRPLRLVDSCRRIEVAGTDFAVTIDKATGGLSSYLLRGEELIVRPMLPSFWRVPTDNDLGIAHVLFMVWRKRWGRTLLRALFPFLREHWKRATLERKVKHVTAHTEPGGEVVVEVTSRVPGNRRPHLLTYRVLGDGEVAVRTRFRPCREMVRLGMQIGVSGAYNEITWFGRGPHENYEDRKTSAPVGIYSSRVADFTFDYIRPQENGNRCDVRWATLTDGKEGSLTFGGSPPISFSAWPYTQEDLEKASHAHELPTRDFITLNIDCRQKGVGSGLTGDTLIKGKPTLKQYTMPKNETYTYGFTMKPGKT
jgi:beta-galactosidase